MLLKTIRSVGEIHVEHSLSDGKGIRITKDFLSQLAIEFAKQAAKYIEFTNEAPFAFKERQLHSIVAPALSRITQAFLMETPITRKWSDVNPDCYNDSHGWIDYWCYYRDFIFLIELKHGFVSSKSGQVKKEVQNDWTTAIEQLSAVKNELSTYMKNSKGVIKLALDILPIFESTRHDAPILHTTKDDLLSTQLAVMGTLNPTSNYCLLWKLHKNLVGPYVYQNKSEYYPGVLFCSYVTT